MGVLPSEFIELVGLRSEKQYRQIESDEIECSEGVINQIHEATGVLPDWIKYKRWRKCEVNYHVWIREPERAAQEIIDAAELGLVYVTIAASTPKSDLPGIWQMKNLWAQATDRYLHVGICLPVSKHKYQVYDLHILLSLWSDYDSAGYGPRFYMFLKKLYDEFGLDVRGIIISDWKDERDLYEGRVHPDKVLDRHYNSHNVEWVQAVLDFERKRPESRWYDQYGNWIRKIQLEFRKYA